MRMAKNRKIFFKGNEVKISELNEIKLRGRQEARTISAEWHGISLFITATKFVSKNGTERIVYQVSTFKAKPIEHVRIYKIRWTIEKSYRTAKQYLGLQDCISTSLDVQPSHASSVLLAYSLLQLECRYYRFESPEKAIRSFRAKNCKFLERRLARWHQLFGEVCV
jgi:SRSO17 transposase